MKKIFFMFIAILLLTSSLVSAETNQPVKTLTPIDENYKDGYYDPRTGETIAAVYRMDENGELYQVSLDQWVKEQKMQDKYLAKEKEIKKDKKYSSSKKSNGSDVGIQAYIWDEYNESGNYQKNGTRVRVSNDLNCNVDPENKCTLIVQDTKTTSSQFSSNLSSSEIGTVISGVSFTYTSSTTSSQMVGYTWEISSGQKAYIGFIPHLRRSYGYLYHYIEDNGVKWESSPKEWSTAEYPQKLSNGKTKGEYLVVYVN